jgi:chemotaxis protein methyltransferase CheR
VPPPGFDYRRKLLRERSGLVLAAEKQYLAESRLLPVARRNGMTTIDELVDRMKSKASVSLTTQVVEAMTTNETFFFRDKLPFDHFRDTIMPALIAARGREKRIRIWCTAASTGQEPYSLAMLLKGMGAAISGYRIDIVATDLSSEILEKAKTGIYTQFEVQRGLAVQLLVKYFDRLAKLGCSGIAQHGAIPPHQPAQRLSALGTFDVVFCRNVLIFDQDTKTVVLDRIARQIPVTDTLCSAQPRPSLVHRHSSHLPTSVDFTSDQRDEAADAGDNAIHLAAVKQSHLPNAAQKD